MAKHPIDFNDIVEAKKRLEGLIQHTPINSSRNLQQAFGAEVHLKLENLQTTGSFKLRGALNKILSLTEQERKRGIVASSAGNHAQGVAYGAHKVGTKATIVMPETSPIVKVLATRGYGAEVVLHGQTYDEAYAKALELAKEKGYTFVHAFDDPMVVAGQGTLGLEILEVVPDLDSIVIPIGGGGLVSGVATAIKHLRPSCKVYGVVAEASPGMSDLYHRRPVSPPNAIRTIADGISVKKPNQTMFDSYISRLVDDVIQVEDDEIAESIVYFLERAKIVVEGSGAAVLAAAQKSKWDLGAKTCLLLSGGNIDMNLVSKIIERGLSRKGRLARLSVVVQDRPGALLRLTQLIAEQGANVLDVIHDRLRTDLHLSETAIEFLLETKSEEHVHQLQEAIRKLGVQVR